ncbi:MAG: aspartate 1-decarboxylase [Flavobacteriales bacterium]|nr:aspartate 1-decarboxylase [Flavobacteriales bacterium]
MLLQIMKSKIHRVRITQADVNYIGSITIDPVLIKAAKMIPGEKVQVLNVSNGERLETYVIEGDQEGEIGINGPAALKMQKGDIVIIVSYAFIEYDLATKHKPMIIFPNEQTNRLE